MITAVQMAPGPRSAAELAVGSANPVPVSSLYRTLSIFEEAGVLRRDHGADGVARYELSEWLTGHHHHIICVSCGAIEDIDVPANAEKTLDDIAGAIGGRAGYRVLDHVLEIEGVCSPCDHQQHH